MRWLYNIILTLGVGLFLTITFAQESPQPQLSPSSPSLLEVQKKLAEEGYAVDPDGIHGRQTENAIRDYQRDNNLEPTGKLNKQTWNRLMPQKEMPGTNKPKSETMDW